MKGRDVIKQMGEPARAERREGISQRFASTRKSLGYLASSMYTAYFIDGFEDSPAYKRLMRSLDSLEQSVLKKYRVRDSEYSE